MAAAAKRGHLLHGRVDVGQLGLGTARNGIYVPIPEGRTKQARAGGRLGDALIQLTEVLHGPFAARQSRAAWRRARCASWRKAWNLFIRFRDTHPDWPNRFIDVSYNELVARPLVTVRPHLPQLDHPR